MAGTLVLDTLQNGAGTASTSADNVINGCAKAWINYKGTATVSIRASYNVSSVTVNSTGNYTINFTNALADANFSAVASASISGAASSWDSLAQPYVYSATSIRLTTALPAAVNDAVYLNVAIFR